MLDQVKASFEVQPEFIALIGLGVEFVLGARGVKISQMYHRYLYLILSSASEYEAQCN
jgi:hypothetical protein